MRKLTCGKCGQYKEPERIYTQGYCRKCHAAQVRANRKKHSELNDEQRKKANCRSYANVYKKKGKLKREPCVVCKGLVTEFHHEDYSKPLEVKNLCRECHLSLHRNTGKIALLNDTEIFGTDYYIPKK